MEARVTEGPDPWKPPLAVFLILITIITVGTILAVLTADY